MTRPIVMDLRATLRPLRLTRTATLFCAAALYASGAAGQSRGTTAAVTLQDTLAARCVTDTRLQQGATLLLESAPHVTRAQVERASQDRGFYAPVLRYWVGRGTMQARERAALAWLNAQQTSRTARCLWAVHGERAALLLAPRFAELTFVVAPYAQSSPERPMVQIAYDLQGERTVSQQSIVALSSGGETARFDSETPVVLARDVRWTLQVMGDDGTGPLPWARWEILAARARMGSTAQSEPRALSSAVTASAVPARVSAEQSSTDSLSEIRDRRQWIATLNRQRVQAGRVALREAPLLEQVALDTAQSLASAGQITHHLHDDSPQRRLARALIHCERLGENVVRATSLASAFAQLNASPAHRDVRDHHAFDSIAVGITRAHDGWFYVVELFAAHPALQNTSYSSATGA